MKIAPVDVKYKNRSYKVLNKDWADIIAAELWNKASLSFFIQNCKNQ